MKGRIDEDWEYTRLRADRRRLTGVEWEGAGRDARVFFSLGGSKKGAEEFIL